MEDKKYSLYLYYDELMLLDGKCNEEAQKMIDKAKTENSFGLDPICNEILAESMKIGKLTWSSVDISQCNCCEDKPRGYHTYARSSRNHYKGDKNYDAPFKCRGIKPNSGFIILQGVSGICGECWYNKYLPKLVNYIIENDLPIEIQKNGIAETRYKKDDIRICYECGKEMRESEMGTSRTFGGDGRYPSTCPYCGAETRSFGQSHKTTDKFKMIKINVDKKEKA